MEKKDEMIISWNPKPEHMFLIKRINDLSGYQYTGQEAPLQLALRYILSLDKNIVGDVLRRAAKTVLVMEFQIENIPKSIKVRVDKNICDKVDEIFRNPDPHKGLGLSRIQRPYYVRVVLTAFYLQLYEENKSLGVDVVEEESEKPGNLFRFNLSVKVADMLLNNTPEDEIYICEIEKIMHRRNQEKIG